MDATQLTIIKNLISTNLASIATLEIEITQLQGEIEKLTRNNERDIATRLVEIAKQLIVLQTAIEQADDHVEDEINKLKQKRAKFESDLEHGKFNFPDAAPAILRKEFVNIFATNSSSFCSTTNSSIEIKKTAINEKRVFTNRQVVINDNQTAESTLKITEDAIIDENHFSVTLSIQHTAIGDLLIDLVSPKGTVIRLHNAEGGGSDNIGKTYSGLMSFNNENARGE